MPRTRRNVFAGTVYHVLNRGNDRARLFDNDSDYRGFLDLMEHTAVHVPMRVVGYDLMPNHIHFLLWPEDDDGISCYMHRLTGTHALQRRFRDSTVGTGHVYQGRFKSFPLQTEAYYYTCLKYVEDNAHRAGLVARAEEWPWSSLHERLRGGEILCPGPLPLPENWSEIVNIGAGADELSEIRTCARTGRPYGDAEWVERAATRHGLEAQLRPRGRPRRK
jgi:putative transposase